jgi:hypothetical protein
MDSRLRVGLLLDSFLLPAWTCTAIERMVSSSAAELSMVVLNQSYAPGTSSGVIPGKSVNHRLYSIFDTLDRKIFLHGSEALVQVDASEIFSGVPVVELLPTAEQGKQCFSASDVEWIESFHLDILVKFGFGNLGGAILSAATYGVWAYRWGDYRKIEDGLAGFWEVVRGWSETGVALQQLGIAEEQNKILFESWLFTYPYSPARNRNYVLWEAASFLSRQVERLHRLGPERFFQALDRNTDGTLVTLHVNPVPSSLVLLWIMLKLAARNFLRVFRLLFFREQWGLLFNFGPCAPEDIDQFRTISPPRDRFWADPHIVYNKPNYYVFIEEYLYRTGKGHISVIKMDQDGNYKQPIPVLQEDFHLSFPLVFDWMGQYYMIPESSERKTIDLYECVRFPDQWKFRITLMKDVHAVDTAVIYVKGTWWLFTAMAEQQAAAPHVELFLFYSKELLTDQWCPHPMNPIVSDAKRSRGAGSLLLKDGRILRPSQYCSSTYGYGFDLNEIVTLSETEYAERTVSSVRPDSMKSFLATHTYASREDLTVVDALTRLPKWAE